MVDHFGDSNVSLVFIIRIEVLASNTDSKTGSRLSRIKIRLVIYTDNHSAT